MKMVDIRKESDLNKLLLSKKTELNQALLNLRTREVKNIRLVRGLKRDIARILTAVKEAK